MKIVKPRRIRFLRPCLGWRWSPFQTSGDEYWRHLTLIGLPWTGRIAFASKQRGCLHFRDGYGVLTIVQSDGNGVRPIREDEVAPGVTAHIDTDTGQVLVIEFETHTPEPYDLETL